MRTAGSRCESYPGSTENVHTDFGLWFSTIATGRRPEVGTVHAEVLEYKACHTHS